MKFLYILVYLCPIYIFTFSVNAQPNAPQMPVLSLQQPEIIPPSPTASALAKVGDFTVNGYTGSVEISIPIYKLNGRDLSENISLLYTGANGIKVQEVAGVASLGWSLMAGGVITRTVMEYPDEDSFFEGYLIEDYSWLNSDTASQIFKQGLAASMKTLYGIGLGTDLEPDIYNCSNGGGRIMYGTDKIPRFIKQDGYKIKQDGIFNVDSSWEVIDPQGNKYIYGGANAQEYSRSRAINVNGSSISFNGIYAGVQAVTSWYLTQKISAEGDTINYTYETGSPYQLPYYSKEITELKSSCGYINYTGSDGSMLYITHPMYLKTITTSQAKASFLYTDRKDIIGMKSIDKILITDLNGKSITSFHFKNDYFSDGGSDSYVRPKLVSLKQFNSTGTDSILVAAFNYNEADLLPNRASSQFDHWGYYNNNITGKRLKSQGAIKDADLDKCQADILTSIDWPTGGQSKFEYELNDFMLGNNELFGGGVRILNIKKKEKGEVLQTNYSYLNTNGNSSGQLQNEFNPDSGYVYTFTSSSTCQGSGTSSIDSAFTEYDIPYFQLFDIDGRSVGYSRMVITYPNRSKEVQLFHDYSELPNKFEGLFQSRLYGPTFNISNLYSSQKYGYFNFKSPFFLKRGLMKEKQLFDSSGRLERRYVYDYNLLKTNDLPIIGQQRRAIGSVTTPNTTTYIYSSSYYSISLCTLQLLSQKVIDYFTSGDSIVILSKNKFRLDYPFLIDQSTNLISNGDTQTISYKHPCDFSFSPYSNMVSNNIIAPRIEESTTINNSLIHLVRNNYSSPIPGLYLPSSIQVQNKNLPLETRETFNVHDPFGNILEEQKANNPKEVYLWGYRNEYPVAKVVGSNYATVSTVINQALLDSAANYTDTQIRTELNKLRAAPSLKGAQITTYTYAPLIGMTSETDPAGRITYYDYDSFGRLSRIRDQDQNVLKSFCYNYAGQAGNCVLSTIAQWHSSGRIRCAPCSANSSFITSMQQHEEIDSNRYSATYLSSRWIDDNVSSSCAVESWQNTTTPIRCTVDENENNTGTQEQEQKDMNPCSPTYNQIRWTVVGTNTTACPIPVELSLNSYYDGYDYFVELRDPNNFNNVLYSFEMYGTGGVLGYIPAGTYTVHISDPSQTGHWFAIGAYGEDGDDVILYNIHLSSTNSVISVD